jgi:hypothetical protein
MTTFRYQIKKPKLTCVKAAIVAEAYAGSIGNIIPKCKAMKLYRK